VHQTHTWQARMKQFVSIMWPILVTQVGLNAMTVIDTMMSGRAGTDDLAGVAIGSSIWMAFFLLITGILLSVTPNVAQLLGSGRQEQIGAMVTQAMYLAVVLAIAVVGIGALFLDPLLHLMNLEESVHHVAKHYLIGLSLGVLPLFVSLVIRNFFDAQGYTKITMFIVMIAVPCNILFNYLFIFGKFGFPELGGIGAGYATSITYWILLIISVYMTFRNASMRAHRLFTRWFAPSWKAWKEQLAVGIPIGLSIFFEASIFSVVTLLMGSQFDTVTIASHQAAFSFATIMFMLPLSMSITLTILVGFEAGAQRYRDAVHYAKLGTTSAITIVTMATIILYFTRDLVASMYTDVPAVSAMIAQFLIYVIFFQLSDASQAALQGVLRGYKDVTIPFVIAFISYWVIGIPVGYGFANYTDLGPFGYWIGITIGLTCAAMGFLARLRWLQRKLTRGT
jgi:MATE family multidrug resistance protein